MTDRNILVASFFHVLVALWNIALWDIASVGAIALWGIWRVQVFNFGCDTAFASRGSRFFLFTDECCLLFSFY